MTPLIYMLLLAAPQTARTPSTAPANVEVERTADGFRLTLTGLEEDDRASQAAIAGIAERVCAPGTPVLGRFTGRRQVTTATDGEQVPASFVQHVTCAPGRDAAVASPVRPPFTADAATQASARAAALAFLAAYDRGDGATSWAMLSEGMQAAQPLAVWTAAARGRAATVGAGAERRIVKLSWYADPPGVAPGVYVAADYLGSSRTQAYLCGYAALLRGNDERWSVVRLETGAIPRSVAATATAERVARLKAEIRCVAG